jgi:cyclic pyranopterin phosphate synthase
METPKPSPRWADKNLKTNFNMVDVGAKAVTRRRAVAQGTIKLTPASFTALSSKKNPKGDVIAIAELAGLLSAKRTSETIPLCHPLPLDKISLSFALDDESFSVVVFCEVITHAKTGVEMEALSGVNGALLTLYDLCKAVDPVISISEVRLNFKQGGKSGTWYHPDFDSYEPPPLSTTQTLKDVNATVITISDRVFRGEAVDTSGPEIESFLEREGARLATSRRVPDEIAEIESAFRSAARDEPCSLIVATGGTGLGPRDVTPEALSRLTHNFIPGFGETLRREGAVHNPCASLSRSTAAIFEGTLIVILPGSKTAVKEGLEALKSVLPHALHVIAGGGH